jgi:hypothetical protein
MRELDDTFTIDPKADEYIKKQQEKGVYHGSEEYNKLFPQLNRPLKQSPETMMKSFYREPKKYDLPEDQPVKPASTEQLNPFKENAITGLYTKPQRKTYDRRNIDGINPWSQLRTQYEKQQADNRLRRQQKRAARQPGFTRDASLQEAYNTGFTTERR